MKCAIYIRVSTGKQAKEGYSLEAQKKAGIRICQTNKWDYEVISEPGRSAKKETVEDRLSLMKILDLAEEGKIQYCFVTEIDRLSRNPVSLAYIKKVFMDNNVKVATLNQTFDFKDDEDDFISDLLGLLAKRENRIRVRRGMRGRLEAALKGKWPGGLLPLGYTTDKDNKLIPEPEERKIYHKIVNWYLEGNGGNTIARKLIQLGILIDGSSKTNKVFKWNANSIVRIIRSPLYKGEFHYRGHIIKVLPLISQEKWELLQKQVRKNYVNAKRSTKRFYLLRGLLYCKKCGRRLYGLIKPSDGRRCYCCLSKKPEPEFRFCGLKNINLDAINNWVWNTIKELVKNSQKMREAIEAQKGSHLVSESLLYAELRDINRSIKEKEKKIDKILDLYTESKILSPVELDKKAKNIKGQKDDLVADQERLMERINKAKQAEQNLNCLEDYMEKVRKRIDNFIDQEKYDFLHLAIDKIIVDYDRISNTHNIEIEGAIPIIEKEAEVPEFIPTSCITPIPKIIVGGTKK